MLRRSLSVLWYLGAALVVIAALGLSLTRLALPMLEARAGQLEALVKKTVGQDVQVGRLEVDWRGLGPELRVYDFALRDPSTAQALLTARELRIDFALLKSLWAWRPVPSRLVLLGSEVGVYRTAEGHLAVEGINVKTPHMNPWLLVLGQPHVELRDIRVQWHDAQDRIPDLVLSNIDLRMRNLGDRHQLEMDLQLPPDYGSRLQVAADLNGATERPLDWSGGLYLAIERAPLAHWLAQRLPEGWRLDGDLSGALWMDLKGGRLRHVQGSLDIARPWIASAAAGTEEAVEQLFSAQRVATRLDWRAGVSSQNESAPGQAPWTLNLDQLQVRQDNADWPETGLTLVASSDPDTQAGSGQQMQLAVDYLRIESVLPLLTRLLHVDTERRTLLQQLQPAGELRGLQLAFTRRNGGIDDLIYQMRFQDVHNTAVEKIPGVAALSGRLVGNQQRGMLELDSHAAHLVLPRLFREPLELTSLSGRIDWQRYADRLRIETAALTAANADIRTQSRLRLDIPADGGKPLLDLQSSFSDGRVEAAYKYMPVGIMPAHTVEWLDRALVSGRISSGGVLFQGRFGDFPFDHANGRLEVRAAVNDAVLDYKEGWHRIEGLAADLTFINRGMRIHGVAGKVLGSDLQDVDVRIDDLAHARLSIDGAATGSLADMLRFLEESPIGNGPAAALGAMSASGDTHLQLGLTIPLAEHKPVEVDGRIQLADDGLALPEWDIALGKLNGELHFTQRGVDGRDLRGTLLGVPVKIDVDDAKSGRQDLTRVRIAGRLPLLERLKTEGDFFARHLTGSSDWLATLYLPKQGDSGVQPRVELQSDLRGIGVDLPQPLGKPVEMARDLRLRADIKAHTLGPLQLQYGEHSAAVALERQDGGLQLARAEVKFGATDAQLPKEAGVRVLGSLPIFVWDDWHALLGDGAPTVGNFRTLDLNLGELSAFGRHFREIHIAARRTEGRWQAQLDGQDMQGTLEIPAAANEPLRLRFARLTIPSSDLETVGSVFNPATVPPLDADVQQLRLRDLDLGHVALTTHPLSAGLAVDSLQVDADWMKFNASGEWTRHNAQDASRFHIGIQGGDLGKMLSAFGYAGSVEGGDTQGEIDANWPGTPTDFTLAKLEGSLEARIGHGRLLNVEAGAGRVFGLFSLQGLRRRLALDFSDVFEKGFSFDRIQGKFSLLDGDAYTNDLVIEGPSARIEISGRTGLARHDYDQLVTVIPQVQSTLPIAGALAGGPVVGAALLLADKLFSQQMEGLTSFARYQYTVTGSWEDPQFKQLPREPARALQKDQSPSEKEQPRK